MSTQQTGGGSLADLPKDPSNELLGRPHGAN
jgi:hypothetical protein